MGARLWLLALLLSAVIGLGLSGGCALDLADLTPFPCASDNTCPEGLACNPDVGCSDAKLDSPCGPETNCATAGPGATCAFGVCTTACDGKGACVAGRVCSSSAGGGSCLGDCSSGQACPSGLACTDLGYNGKRGCTQGGHSSPIDGPCATNADCAAAGAGVACVHGICAAPCTDGGCAAGHVCSSSAGAGVCLPDCTAGEACGQGLACDYLWYEGRRGCIGAGSVVPSCSMVEVIGPCPSASSVCGTEVDQQACTAGCPKLAPCTGANECDTVCSPGSTAMTCQGAPCFGQECQAGNWWCAPTGTTLGCNDDPSHFISFCHCVNGVITVSSCGNPLTCEQLCRNECDPIEQDCSGSERGKCSLAFDEDAVGNLLCVAEAGTVAEGEACQRNGAAQTGVGQDDCAPGLFCTAAFSPQGQFVCRRFCTDEFHCPDLDMVCTRYAWRPGVELCAPRCTVFAEPSECEQGTFCKAPGYCMRSDAAKEEGEWCVGFENLECAGNLSCHGYGRCAAPCDATHPCVTGTCSLFKGSDLGLCEGG